MLSIITVSLARDTVPFSPTSNRETRLTVSAQRRAFFAE
jgi:hypothetical protein